MYRPSTSTHRSKSCFQILKAWTLPPPLNLSQKVARYTDIMKIFAWCHRAYALHSTEPHAEVLRDDHIIHDIHTLLNVKQFLHLFNKYL